MQKFTDFLLSLVSPLKMIRYRSMSVLIAIIIFLLSVQVIYFPYKQAIRKQAPEIETDYSLFPLKALPNTEEVNNFVTELKSYGCAIDKSKRLVCANLTDGTLIEKTFVFDYEGYTKKLHFYLDYYQDEEPQLDLKDGFASKDYPYVENEEDYFLVLTPEYIYYQPFTMLTKAEKEDPVKHGDYSLVGFQINLPYSYFKDFTLSVDEPEVKGYSLGPYLARKIVEGIVEIEISRSLLNILLTTVLLPLVFIFMFWLVFKRTGHLKYFKEYYNIAAISSIVPLLVTFGVAWFFPVVINWYIFIFSLFYIFVLYRINNSPEVV